MRSPISRWFRSCMKRSSRTERSTSGNSCQAPRDRLAVLDELVGGVLATEHVHERAGLAVTRRGRRVERGRLVAGRGLLGLQHLLDRAAQVLRHLAHLRRASELLGEDLRRAADRERALLEVARHAQRPALVAEMALQLAENRGCGVARELRAAAGLEPVDRLDQPEARDLEQIVERLVGVDVAQRQVARQRQEPLHELLPRGKVSESGGSGSGALARAPARQRGRCLGVGGLGQPRRCEGDCTHREPPSVFGVDARSESRPIRPGSARRPFMIPEDVASSGSVCPSSRFPSSFVLLPDPISGRNELRFIAETDRSV